MSKEINIPKEFELINKKVFDLLLKYLNDKRKKNLQVKYDFNVYIGDNKIFIQDLTIKNKFYIYSINNPNKEYEYKLEYKIKFINYDIKNFFSKCENNQNFEEILTKYSIDLSMQKDQYQLIIDDNLQKIAEIKNINVNPNKINLKEPNHCLGLENIGATCYMNATIQCLCNILNIKRYFKNKQLVYNDINNNNSCQLTKEFYKLIINLWKEPKNNKKYYTPTDFKNCISQMNRQFKGIAANDSKDLILFIYETIHNEINKKNQYKQINDNNMPNELKEFRNNYYSNNKSIIMDTFYFEQQNILHCSNCNFDKISYNIANILIFPLEKVRESMAKKFPNGFVSVSLENCFENYEENEELKGANRIYCNHCNNYSDGSTSNKTFTCPEVMTIILNRGKGLQFDVNFEYPLTIDISKYVINESNDNCKYELICILSHFGPSGMAGHFIAFCISPVDKKWYCYNDAIVTECIDPRLQKNGEIEGIPYVLFYQKIKKKENNNNNITLYFNYKEKEFFLNVDKKKTINDLINELKTKYHLEKIDGLYYYTTYGQGKYLEPQKSINDYNLPNEAKITVLFS